MSHPAFADGGRCYVRRAVAVGVARRLWSISPIDRVVALDDDFLATNRASRLFLVLDDILADVDVFTHDRSFADLNLFATQRDLSMRAIRLGQHVGCSVATRRA